MTQSILVSGRTATVLRGQDDPERVIDLLVSADRIRLVRQALDGSNATDLIGRDAATIAVSREGELGDAYAQLFNRLGVSPESLAA
jgi:hypothetical protein